MELDNEWRFGARLEVFGYQDTHLNLIVSDLLVRGAVNAEAIKSRCWGGIIERSHIAAGRRRDVESRVRLVLDVVGNIALGLQIPKYAVSEIAPC
jgi:hypothetical protein